MFLAQLATALDARAPERSSKTAKVLPFQMVYLGQPSARSPNGGFSDAPGDWFATKLFLAEGEGEVFFNFNPVSGEAEFSIKDSEYGDIVVRETPKILW